MLMSDQPPGRAGTAVTLGGVGRVKNFLTLGVCVCTTLASLRCKGKGGDGVGCYRYEATDYRPYQVRHGGDCDTCAQRSACTVDDNQLKTWDRAGLYCLSWSPDRPVDFAGI